MKVEAPLSKFAFVVCTLALAACSQSNACSSDKDVADKVAKLAAEVQSASLAKKISTEQLRVITVRVELAGQNYKGSKDRGKYCADLDAIEKEFGF